MAAVDGHTARFSKSSAAKSRHVRYHTGTRSTDAVVGLAVSPSTVMSRQSVSLPPLSVQLHAAVSQGLIDTAAELLDSGVICGPDKVLCIFLLLSVPCNLLCDSPNGGHFNLILTLSPLTSHSIGSPDPHLPDRTLFLTVLYSKFPRRYFSFTRINQRHAGRYFGLTRNL